MIIKNIAYLTLNGNEYKGYTLYLAIYSKFDDSYIAVTQDFYTNLCTGDLETIDKTAAPAEGCSLYVAPNCAIPIDDLRNRYTIKRSIDTGDYNVLSPNKISFKYTYKTTFAVIPSRKIIVACDGNLDSNNMLKYINQNLPGIGCSGMYIETIRTRIYYIKDCSYALRKLLSGTCKKPWVLHTQLKFSSVNTLDLDVLQLLYSIGINYTETSISDFIRQLVAINQYNWREYKGTMSLLLAILSSFMTFTIISRKKSCLPKAAAIIVKECNSPTFMSSEDIRLAQSFISQIMNMNDLRFVAFDALYNKLVRNSIPIHYFTALYKSIVKIEPITEKQ